MLKQFLRLLRSAREGMQKIRDDKVENLTSSDYCLALNSSVFWGGWCGLCFSLNRSRSAQPSSAAGAVQIYLISWIYIINQGSPCRLATLNPFGRELLLSDVSTGIKWSTWIGRSIIIMTMIMNMNMTMNITINIRVI
jgi:hypothetical protein